MGGGHPLHVPHLCWGGRTPRGSCHRILGTHKDSEALFFGGLPTAGRPEHYRCCHHREKNVSFWCGQTLGPWLPYLYLLVGDEKGMPLEAQTGPARLGTKADTAGS